MAEHRIVVPGVVGSSPITHPTFFIAIDSSFSNDYCQCNLPSHSSLWMAFFILWQHAQNEFMKKDL